MRGLRVYPPGKAESRQRGGGGGEGRCQAAPSRAQVRPPPPEGADRPPLPLPDALMEPGAPHPGGGREAVLGTLQPAQNHAAGALKILTHTHTPPRLVPGPGGQGGCEGSPDPSLEPAPRGSPASVGGGGGVGAPWVGGGWLGCRDRARFLFEGI